MTYIVPNFFIENNDNNLFKIDNLFCLNYITKQKNDFISIRTTMHCMIILLDGSKVIHLKDADVSINSNEICFLAQNNYFMSEKIIANLSYKSLIIYFDDKFIFDLMQKYKIKINSTNKNNVIKLNCSQDMLFKSNISLLQEYLHKRLDNNLLKLKIEEIILHSLRINKNLFLSFLYSITSTSQDRIKFILESNIDLIQTLDDMCSITRLTQNQLRRYIKKKYNITPKVWIDAKRLEKTTLMLKNTNKTITDISSECGYSTVSWFISQFKKQYNQTPKEFRHKI
ncbi:Transcriptional regulator, AraC family [hydrothermal vent metagenome]|uniref:Transcriptional regulator, AraC family n=1 Tax=hydrothermal vent metagenome TaxID=652676 RepID=A0A3B1E0B1_9ZZZZ